MCICFVLQFCVNFIIITLLYIIINEWCQQNLQVYWLLFAFQNWYAFFLKDSLAAYSRRRSRILRSCILSSMPGHFLFTYDARESFFWMMSFITGRRTPFTTCSQNPLHRKSTSSVGSAWPRRAGTTSACYTKSESKISKDY